MSSVASATHGELWVVGTGIRAISQVTPEARDRLTAAEIVHYLVADPLTERWLRETNSRCRSLADCYEAGKERQSAYGRMVERILADLRRGLRVAVALYGHPGVFAMPGHEAIRVAVAEGYPAEMLPAISSEDCMFADLGLDPARRGCQSYEATDFVLHPKLVEPSAVLVLWQVGLVGDLRYAPVAAGGHLTLLTERLGQLYERDHRVIVYEAAQFQVARPRIEHVALGDLVTAEITTASTLVVPPAQPRRADANAYAVVGLPVP